MACVVCWSHNIPPPSEKETFFLLIFLSNIGKHRSTISSPKQLTEEKCCTQKRCLQKVLSISQMTRARENFCQEYPTYEKQRKYVFNWLENNQPTGGEFTYTISGINVCWSAWMKVLGISRRRFFELKRDFLLGRRSEQHGAALTSRDTTKRGRA